MYEISPELLNRFVINSQIRHLVPHSDELEGQGQRSKSRGTKNSVFRPFRVRFMFGKTSLASSLLLCQHHVNEAVPSSVDITAPTVAAK